MVVAGEELDYCVASVSTLNDRRDIFLSGPQALYEWCHLSVLSETIGKTQHQFRISGRQCAGFLSRYCGVKV